MCVVECVLFFRGQLEKQAIFIAIPFDESQNIFILFYILINPTESIS
jgi:hypothetical protein